MIKFIFGQVYKILNESGENRKKRRNFFYNKNEI